MKNADTENRGFKCITTITMLYAMLLLISSSLTHKFIAVGHHTLSAGSFIMPIWFMVGDIITEVYGFRESRRLMWNLMILDFFIYLILQGFSLIQAHHSQNGQAYYIVFGSMLRTYFSIWICLFFANFINTYMIAKMKIFFRSRHFWWRTIAASSAAEILYTVAGFYAILGGVVPAEKLMWLIIWGVFLKISITVLLSFPATMIQGFLKRVENIDIYDTRTNFNPFKFEI